MHRWQEPAPTDRYQKLAHYPQHKKTEQDPKQKNKSILSSFIHDVPPVFCHSERDSGRGLQTRRCGPFFRSLNCAIDGFLIRRTSLTTERLPFVLGVALAIRD